MRVRLYNDNTTIRQRHNTNKMNCEQQEWIDLYLFGELKGEDLLCFEKKMHEDADFREDVHLQEEIFLGIRSYHAAKPKKATAKVVNLSFRKVWTGVAAALVFVSMLSLMMEINLNTQNENTQYVYNNYHLKDVGIIAPFKDKYILPHFPSWIDKPLPELI